MKKLVAGVATAAALSLGALSLAGAPAEAYGPPTPVTHVAKEINTAIHKTLNKKGHIGPKKAKKLIKKVKAAKKAGLISPVKAKALLHKIKHHEKKK